MQIGVFGGSFDPVHLGHLLAAKKLIKSKRVDQVWLMPCYAHVWKKELTAIKDRLAMLQFLESPQIKISTLEVEQKREVYTVETLKILKKRYPQNRFFWLVGEKSWPELPKWRDYKQIKDQILIVPNIANISSTLIRERVKKGLSIKGLVQKKAAEYIKSNQLYKNV